MDFISGLKEMNEGKMDFMSGLKEMDEGLEKSGF